MFRSILPVLALLLVGQIVHSHTHSHEPAHLKYTKEVNEQAVQEEDHGHVHAHAHSHEGGGGCPHAHAHSHEAADHGHSHGEHAHTHSHSHGHSHEEPVKTKTSPLVEEYQYEGHLSFMNDARTRLWVHAIGATMLISVAPFLILTFIPVQANTSENGPLLKVLLAFGSGGLLGDAFLHLIPHAQPADGGHSHSHSHSHSEGHAHGPHDMSVGGWVLGGIIAFLTIEKLLRILRGGEGHGHSHGPQKKEKLSDDESDSDSKKKGKKDKKKVADAEPVHESIKIAAYLNLAADFAHNFTDGLAIGASFIAGTTVGVVTMVTVLVHEVPHEIGDFAILIQSGYSKKKAMLIQLVTALGAMSGCVLSLYTSNADLAEEAASSWVLPFTAGGFIYIATVSVIPELLENSSVWQSIKEIIALLTGIFMMYLIAMYE